MLNYILVMSIIIKELLKQILSNNEILGLNRSPSLKLQLKNKDQL